jgi:hypothetical protein
MDKMTKYGLAYKKYANPKKKSVEKPEKKQSSLNEYQQFVKKESALEKYKNLPGSERLSLIAKEWEKIKRKKKK